MVAYDLMQYVFFLPISFFFFSLTHLDPITKIHNGSGNAIIKSSLYFMKELEVLSQQQFNSVRHRQGLD